MKRLFLSMGGLLLLLLVLAACGGSTGNGMEMGANSSPSSSAGTGRGAAMLTVQVTETEYQITSSLTQFAPGVAYHFVVTNKGQAAHEFMIMPKPEGAMHGMSMGDMDHMALARIETLAPGQSKTVNYTFSSSATDSHPEFVCYLAGHYEAGMKLDVAVKV